MTLTELAKLHSRFLKEKQAMIDNISHNIKTAREAKKLTQEEVAEALGVTRTNFNHIENGKVNLTVEKFIDLCLILGVEVNDLLNSKTVD